MNDEKFNTAFGKGRHHFTLLTRIKYQLIIQSMNMNIPRKGLPERVTHVIAIAPKLLNLKAKLWHRKKEVSSYIYLVNFFDISHVFLKPVRYFPRQINESTC